MAVPVEGDSQIVARQDRLHAFEQGAGGPKRKEREQMIEAADIGHRRYGARGEQRLDLRGEINEVALARPVERADADPIARVTHLAKSNSAKANWPFRCGNRSSPCSS